MSLKKALFGTTGCGKDIYLYSLENKEGMKAQVMNYGAVLVRLYAPDKSGKFEDVVFGYDKLEDYHTNAPNFGATIGPNANRIKDASFELEGITYDQDKNDGNNNLHSHADLGYHKKVWDAEERENSILFSLDAPDGEMGFPGNKKITVSYILTEENELCIHYHAISDRNTVINMTNHTYFNLAGHGSGEIYDHILTINASNYTPVAAGGIPTGEIVSVIGTPMDFTCPRRIGDRINDDFEQLKITNGYDHNWVIDGEEGVMHHAATLEEMSAGRRMKVYTDLPGVQFYAGNFMEKEKGKDGVIYNWRQGLCLETQYYPNAINEPSFPSVIFGPDREYDTTTIYKFEVM